MKPLSNLPSDIDSNRQEGGSYCDVQGSEGSTMNALSGASEIFARFLPEQGDMYSSSAIGFWGSCWSNKSTLATGNTAHLGLVNAASSMPSWSWSAICIDLAFAAADCQAPAGIDLINVIPSDELIAQWIMDINAFVCENNAGFDESNKICGAHHNDHQERGHDGAQSALNEGRPQVEATEGSNECSYDIITAGAKSLAAPAVVTAHSHIFPQVSEVLS
jgi:hypothetical protein